MLLVRRLLWLQCQLYFASKVFAEIAPLKLWVRHRKDTSLPKRTISSLVQYLQGLNVTIPPQASFGLTSAHLHRMQFWQSAAKVAMRLGTENPLLGEP